MHFNSGDKISGFAEFVCRTLHSRKQVQNDWVLPQGSQIQRFAFIMAVAILI